MILQPKKMDLRMPPQRGQMKWRRASRAIHGRTPHGDPLQVLCSWAGPKTHGISWEWVKKWQLSGSFFLSLSLFCYLVGSFNPSEKYY
jgi:hypothetical protein